MAQSSQTSPFLRIGTRGSKLALWQAHAVRDALASAHGVDPAAIAIEVIRTTGDAIQDRPLSEAGGKGLFTKEIEEALASGAVDIAVHSCKDMPTALPHGHELVACLPREDVRDAFISPRAGSVHDLPRGAVVGTASLRRQAMVRRLRPDIAVVTFRGNVDTRLKKLGDGAVDATLLALAGLRRLGREAEATAVLDTDAFLPAVGQGAVGIEARTADRRTCDLLAQINHFETFSAVAAERAFLAVLDGSCRTPIAGHARIGPGDRIVFRGMILRPDGSEMHETEATGAVADGPGLAADAARDLKGRTAPGFFAAA